MKKIVLTVMSAFILFAFSGCTLCTLSGELNGFYDKIIESKELLDAVSNDIHLCWYNASYNGLFNGDIGLAVMLARGANTETIVRLSKLDEEICSSFNRLKKGRCGELAADVMTAYREYYEFVTGACGSLYSSSRGARKLESELSHRLEDLSRVL